MTNTADQTFSFMNMAPPGEADKDEVAVAPASAELGNNDLEASTQLLDATPQTNDAQAKSTEDCEAFADVARRLDFDSVMPASAMNVNGKDNASSDDGDKCMAYGKPASPMTHDEDPTALFGFAIADLKKPCASKENVVNDAVAGSWMDSLASSQDSMGSWASASEMTNPTASSLQAKVSSEEPALKKAKVGLVGSEVSSLASNQDVGGRTGKCHNCNQLGHWASDCKNIVSKMMAGRDSKCALCPHAILKGNAIVKLGSGPFTFQWVHRSCGLEHLVKLGLI